jgi:hypothetical protein
MKYYCQREKRAEMGHKQPIAHVARKATPMTVIALTRTAQMPPRLTPHVLIMTEP